MTETNRHPYLPEKTILLLRQDDGTHEIFISEDIPEDLVVKVQELVAKQNDLKRIMNLFGRVNV